MQQKLYSHVSATRVVPLKLLLTFLKDLSHSDGNCSLQNLKHTTTGAMIIPVRCFSCGKVRTLLLLMYAVPRLSTDNGLG